MYKEPFRLTGIKDAQKRLAEAFAPERVAETVSREDCVGRIAAEDLRARDAVPGFSRSTKDGFAVAASDTQGAGESLAALLTVAGEVRMGVPPDFVLAPGSCARIATGGMLPEGADAVVMLEYAEELSPREVLLSRTVPVGENVLLRGEDVSPGDLLIPRGRRIRAGEAGLLAGQGWTGVPVWKPLSVGILSTGDEVVAPEREPGPGQVRDTNQTILFAEVRETGARPVGYGILPDDPGALREAVARAFRENDMVLVSGGSSVGSRDYCLAVFGEITGGAPLFHGLPLKPGKPALGAARDGKVLLGLPGHPVSARTVFRLLARPLLWGTPFWPGRQLPARLARSIASEAGRDEMVQVQLEETGEGFRAEPLLGTSGMVSLLSRGDGEFMVPAGTEGVREGTTVLVTCY